MARRSCGPPIACRAPTGAAFHPRSATPTRPQLVIRKGFRPEIDSYSAFFENDRTTPTGLEGYLRSRGVTAVTLVGLATDYLRRLFGAGCGAAGVRGRRVLEGACRAIDLNGSPGRGAATRCARPASRWRPEMVDIATRV